MHETIMDMPGKSPRLAPRRALLAAATPPEAVKTAAGASGQEVRAGTGGQAPRSDEP